MNNLMDGNDLILIAEDNPDDALLLRRAFQKLEVRASIKFVSDGEDLILYLEGRGAYANRAMNPLPSFMILDLKMPRKGGLEVLEWIENNPGMAVVPTVIMSSSLLEADIRSAYNLGANTYFVKPSTFDDLLETVRMLKVYWDRAQRVRPLREPLGGNSSLPAAAS